MDGVQGGTNSGASANQRPGLTHCVAMVKGSELAPGVTGEGQDWRDQQYFFCLFVFKHAYSFHLKWINLNVTLK